MARLHNGMRPIHPGEILREEYLAPLGMTANALATALHVTPARINDIVRERRGITPDTALRLARYFGGDAETWLNLQQAFDLAACGWNCGERTCSGTGTAGTEAQPDPACSLRYPQKREGERRVHHALRRRNAGRFF